MRISDLSSDVCSSDLRARQDAGEVEAGGFALGVLESLRLRRRFRGRDAAPPPVGQRPVARIEQVVVRRGADLVGSGPPAPADRPTQRLHLTRLGAHRFDQLAQRPRRTVSLTTPPYTPHEPPHPPPLTHPALTP